MFSTMRFADVACSSGSIRTSMQHSSQQHRVRHIVCSKQQSLATSSSDYIIPGYKQYTLSYRAGTLPVRPASDLIMEAAVNKTAQNRAAMALLATAQRGWMLATAASIDSVDFADLSLESTDQSSSNGRAELEQYEAGMAETRASFMTVSGLDGFFKHLTTLDRQQAEKLLASFLLVFTAVGSRMTAPVQSWIQRAGEACIREGFTAVGEELKKHAVGEAGHDKWYVNDARSIATFMASELGVDGVDADLIMSQENPEPVKQYAILHENVIESAAPYCQLAIENEIELLSLQIGKPFLGSIMKYLGADFNKKCMTFVARHVVADEDHCVENEEMLLELLAEHPEATEQLMGVGKDSLQVYANHLRHCIREGYSLANVQMPANVF